MLSPGQAAHVLALYLAPRPLSADELRWLTGEAARPGDAARKQDLAALERLRMAERVPGGTPCWRAGPDPAQRGLLHRKRRRSLSTF